MPDDRKVISAFMMSLVRDVGGYDAAALIISQRWGRPISKGTLTKKKNGELDWSITDMMALQEIAGRTPLTDWLVTLDKDPEEGLCVMDAAATFARESGEALAAVMSARTPEDRAKAIKELCDVKEAAGNLRDAMEGRS